MANIAKRPDGRYRARYRDGEGKEYARHFNRKIDAQRWIDGVTTAVTTGMYVDPVRSRVTVGEFGRQWLAGQDHLKVSTRTRYEGLFRVQVEPWWESIQLGDVRYADVVAWISSLHQAGLSASSIRQAHRVLSLILELAVRDGRMPRNASHGVPLPRAAKPVKRFLTHAQVADLAEAAGTDALPILVLAYCGLRYGELVALRVGRVDLLRRRLTVAESASDVGSSLTFTTPKSHQTRSVPVPRFVADQLAFALAGKGPDEFVFTAPAGGPLRLGNFRRRVFDPAAVAAGLSGLTPHELRHTAASLAVRSGANVKAVQRMLGHASAAMTLDVYSGLFDDDLDAVAERMDAAAVADSLRTRATITTLSNSATGL